MGNLATTVREARPDDAQRIARVYIDSWQDTYPAILPRDFLRRMSLKGQTARWRAAVRGGSEKILVAECSGAGIVGMTSFGAAQDRAPGYDGEIYTLYVSPDHFGCGVGGVLLRSAFGALRGAGFTSCVIWAHAKNPARYFYESLGGRLIAERSRGMWGTTVPEAAFGWRSLQVAQKRHASGGTITRP